MSEAAAMSDRDLLIKIANDSEHTKSSVDKLWTKSDELNTTVSAMRVTQDVTSKTVERFSEAIFTGDNALSPRVRVLEDKRSGKASRPPPATAPAESASNANKAWVGVVMALIAIISTLVASR